MDQKRIFMALAISAVILIAFQFIQAEFLPHPPPPAVVASQSQPDAASTPAAAAANAPGASGTAGTVANASAVAAANGPRLQIDTPNIIGSMALTGAVLDDVQLKAYHETTAKNSPLVQILGRRDSKTPFYTQFGWTNPAGSNIAVPTDSTVWTASANTLTPDAPVTLSWDNGAGVIFQQVLSVDDKFMFSVTQHVINHTSAPIKLYDWGRVARDYLPVEQKSYILYDGPLGVINGTLKQISYASTKSDGTHSADGTAYSETSNGGWLGITDKYWLTALIPAQDANLNGAVRYLPTTLGDGHAYQTDFISNAPETIAPGATSADSMHLFTGAKVVKTLDAYETQYNIPSFDHAVDFGHLYLITKPIFFCLDWLNSQIGNFGLAIMVFTVGVKALFFPLASYSYRSMGKMKAAAPKIKALKELYKDDNTKIQQETMALYKAEKINPASGCLPMLVQIPVFFALYKVIYITIEMRQAPFYGWIHDLSAPDPTNIFNLFGLIPFDPTVISPYLGLGALPIIMGFTMFLQQKLNPAPPDPVQARMFQFMPIIFTFMLARFPAGLVLYWTWNNLLSVGQQWLIMRRAAGPKTTKTVLAKT
ncbi:MAG: membrane protein insertase YidC [Acidocella sp.]|nr:membrane protein insertase YidC [Acidocella sp.]